MKKPHSKSSSLNRRSFLGRSLAWGTGALALGGPLASWVNPAHLFAASDADPGFKPKSYHFVFYYFGGGWDTMISWDPRDPELFNESNMGETGIQPGYQLLDTTPKHGIYVDSNIGPLGGFVGDLRLPKYTDRICVVRGLNMETLSHEGGALRFFTGRMPEGPVPARDSTDVVMASLLGGDELVPNIALGGHPSFNNREPSYATALSAGSTASLVAAMTRTNELDPALESQIKAILNQQGNCPHAVTSQHLVKAHGSRTTVEEMLGSGLSDNFDFTAKTEKVEAIRDHYGFASNQLSSVEAMTALAEQALTQQISRCISIRSPFNYDTHGTLEQGPSQMKAYNAIARLMDNLEKTPYPDNSGDSWLDRTTIMCTSEFSRSPLINTRVGRDHWLTNSCVLAGGGIKGNQVVGESSDLGMAPRPTNLTTGKVDLDAKAMTPDNLIRGLYTMLGYEKDVADLRVKPLTAILKDG